MTDIYSPRMELHQLASIAKGVSETVIELSDRHSKLWALQYGSKRLELSDSRDGFSTYIKNVKGKEIDKKKQETTILYLAILELMKNIAKMEGSSKTYILKTDSRKMALWALTTGDEIFHWEQKPKVNEKGIEDLSFNGKTAELAFITTISNV